VSTKALRQFVGSRARRDLDEPDRHCEQEAHAQHRQDAEHAQQERIPQALAEEAKDHGRDREHDDEGDQAGKGPGARILVDDRYGIKIAPRLLGHA
jgi:hypothetical protein